MSKIAELTKRVEAAHAKLENLDKPAIDANRVVGGTPGNPANAPYGTSGPILKDSQRFSMYNFVRNGISGKGRRELAKMEMDVSDKFTKAIRSTGNMLVVEGADSDDSVWLPNNISGGFLDGFTPELTSTSELERDMTYVKSVISAPKAPIDYDEVEYLVRKGIITKAGAQSAFFSNQGGDLVGPPVQGPVIPLIRPSTALMAAGASSMVLPPSGKYVEPRITGAPSVSAVAESSDYATSNMSTDQMTLQAKKIGGAVYLSKESSLFTSGTQDQWVTSLLNGSLGLKFDAYGMYGVGGSAIPLGLVGYTGSNQVIDVYGTYTSAKGIGNNGNVLQPEFGARVPALLEERSFGQDSSEPGMWVMRPYAAASVMSQRATAVQPGDQAGVFVNILQKLQEQNPSQWAGYGVVKSTNVRNDQVKGSSGATLSDAFYGIWKYMVIATYGAVQFEQGNDGNTFLRDQIIVKGTMFGDIGLRYPGAFAWLKQIILATPSLG